MLEWVTNVIDTLSAGDPTVRTFLTTGLVAGPATAITVMMRSLPSRMFHIIKDRIVVHGEVRTLDDVGDTYDRLEEWAAKNAIQSLTRSVSVMREGKNLSEKRHVLPLGTTWVKDPESGRVFIAQKRMERDDRGVKDKSITITTIGLTADPIRHLLARISEKNDVMSIGNISAHGMNRGEYFKRNYHPFSNVVVRKDVQNKLTHVVSEFESSFDFYRRHDIPYKLCLMFEGPPGTGKTSLVRAVAHLAGRNILSVAGTNLAERLTSPWLSEGGTIIVIEDIDRISGFLRPEFRHDADDDGGKLLKDMLNFLNGPIRRNDQIIILTANRFDQLDEALVRPGRIDHVFHIGLLEHEDIEQYIKNRYDVTVSIDTPLLPMRGCDLHQIFLEHPRNVDGFMASLHAIQEKMQQEKYHDDNIIAISR